MTNLKQSFDTEYDLVVVGGGASGKSAALTAVQAGLSVAILEKLPEALGSGQHAEGLAAFESSEQMAREGKDGIHFPTKEEGYRAFMEFSHYRANTDVVRMFVNNSAETVDILKGIGVEFRDVLAFIPEESDELSTFHLPVGLGMRCQELLLKAVQEAGPDIFTSTVVEHLILQDGAVVGVIATDADGNTLKVGAKAVIIATGGYANSLEARRKYNYWIGDTDKIAEAAVCGNTGDGIELALEAGGTLANIGVLQMAGGGLGKMVTSQSGAAGIQPWLWVNRFGRRFVGEEISPNFAKTGMSLFQQPGSTAYGILDADALQYLKEIGSESFVGEFVPRHKPMEHLQEELEADMASGVAWRADTIEELAVAMGVDPTALVQTVVDYNAACDAGYDPEFYKPAKYLRPMRKPPFYAIATGTNLTCSCGGIRVNGNLQVTDGDYRPIPGLYAVGNDASGLYGDSYSFNVTGATNGFAFTSGRVAARHVIAALNEGK